MPPRVLNARRNCRSIVRGASFCGIIPENGETLQARLFREEPSSPCWLPLSFRRTICPEFFAWTLDDDCV